MPTSANEITLARKDIEVLNTGEEELPYTPKQQAVDEMIEECAEVQEPAAVSNATRPRTINYVEESYKHFSAMPIENQRDAREFDLKYGKEDDDVIKWTILSEEEQITECPMEGKEEIKNKDVLKEGIPWDADPSKVDYCKILLEKFFPSLEGKAKVLDEFLTCNSFRGNPWKETVLRDNIKFERTDSDDPDELVSCSLLFIIARLVYNYLFLFRYR